MTAKTAKWTWAYPTTRLPGAGETQGDPIDPSEFDGVEISLAVMPTDPNTKPDFSVVGTAAFPATQFTQPVDTPQGYVSQLVCVLNDGERSAPVTLQAQFTEKGPPGPVTGATFEFV